jgi:hypothetical protein
MPPHGWPRRRLNSLRRGRLRRALFGDHPPRPAYPRPLIGGSNASLAWPPECEFENEHTDLWSAGSRATLPCERAARIAGRRPSRPAVGERPGHGARVRSEAGVRDCCVAIVTWHPRRGLGQLPAVRTYWRPAWLAREPVGERPVRVSLVRLFSVTVRTIWSDAPPGRVASISVSFR